MFRKYFFLLFLQFCCIYDIFAQPYCDVRTFSLRDGLAANVISGIGQTGDGLMWLGTWSGLCYYDGYRFTTFRSMPGLGDMLTSNRIYTLHTNYRNDVWVTTYDRRLYLLTRSGVPMSTSTGSSLPPSVSPYVFTVSSLCPTVTHGLPVRARRG